MPAAAEHGDAIRAKAYGAQIPHLRLLGTVPGVVPLAAAACNGPGTGLLRWDGAGLSWRAPGGLYGTAIAPDQDAQVLLLEDGADPNQWLRVQVRTAHLSAGWAEGRVLLADRYGKLPIEDASPTEAENGAEDVYIILLWNESDGAVQNVRIWLDPASEYLEIGWNAGGPWYAPTTEWAGIVHAGLAAGGYTTLYVRRTIPPASAADPRVLTWLRLSWETI